MNPNLFPRPKSEIVTLIKSTQKEGPKAIARLATLCLWLVGQDDDPRTKYPGPEGHKPLDYLLIVIEDHWHKNKPWLGFSSIIGELRRQFPKPRSVASLIQIPDKQAREQVEAVFREASRAETIQAEHRIYCNGLRDLARRGLTKEQLQSLVQTVSTHPLAGTEAGHPPWDVQALAAAGEENAAKQILASVPLSARMGAITRIDYIRTLAEIGRLEEARGLIDELWVQWGQVHPERREYDKQFVAEIYAYLGEAQIARDIIQPRGSDEHLKIECLIAWNQYFNGQPTDISTILRMLDETVLIEIPTHRAYRQIHILEYLLAIGRYDDAWSALPLIRETLLEIIAFDKLEYRTNFLSATLAEHANQHVSTIYPFVSDLLVSKAKCESDSDIWGMVQMVCGLGWVILRWVDDTEVQSVVDFLKAWRDN